MLPHITFERHFSNTKQSNNFLTYKLFNNIFILLFSQVFQKNQTHIFHIFLLAQRLFHTPFLWRRTTFTGFFHTHHFRTIFFWKMLRAFFSHLNTICFNVSFSPEICFFSPPHFFLYFPVPGRIIGSHYLGELAVLRPCRCSLKKGNVYLPQAQSFPEFFFGCNILYVVPFWGHFWCLF